MGRAMIKKILSENKELQKDLFVRGFLITQKEIENMDDFPFYGNWKSECHRGYYFLGHELTGMHIYENQEGTVFFIIGHAYNPFTMHYKECEILKYLAEAHGTDEYVSRVNELTGVFVYGTVADGKIEFIWKTIDEISKLDLRPHFLKEIIISNTKINHFINIRAACS